MMKKNRFKKPICILTVLMVWFSSCAAVFPWEVKVTLDASENVAAPESVKEFSVENSQGTIKASFSVPKSWESVCEKMENAYGYQFKLNEIEGCFRTEPEQLYIFYFDPEKYLADLAERQNTKKIERAIVKNILPDDQMRLLEFPVKTIKRNGKVFKKYSYYITGYKDPAGNRHNVEFVFLPSKEGDIICVVYVFLTSDHKDEAISLLRSIKVNGD